MFHTVLTVLRAFPCRTRLADKDAAPAVEEEVSLFLFLTILDKCILFSVAFNTTMNFIIDLSKSLHEGTVIGGVVSQSPARPRPSVATGH